MRHLKALRKRKHISDRYGWKLLTADIFQRKVFISD